MGGFLLLTHKRQELAGKREFIFTWRLRKAGATLQTECYLVVSLTGRNELVKKNCVDFNMSYWKFVRPLESSNIHFSQRLSLMFLNTLIVR